MTGLATDPAATDWADQCDELAEFVADGGVLVLSGAGLSTESGIPDYRGVTGRARPATPMTYAEFVGDPAARQRYWARSHLGWRTIVEAEPNRGHRGVAGMQVAGLLSAVITQNVDGLHTAAGARDVIELHGALNRVRCLDCGDTSSRTELEGRLRAVNPGVAVLRPADVRGDLKPDGDVDLSDDAVAGFRLVDCHRCGTGMLKPDVVFFGESVPAERVAECYRLTDAARAVLVLGSSLTVASGFRFVRRAVTRGIPVAIVNQGPTRGDRYAQVKIEAPLGDVLSLF